MIKKLIFFSMLPLVAVIIAAFQTLSITTHLTGYTLAVMVSVKQCCAFPATSFGSLLQSFLAASESAHSVQPVVN